MKSNNLIGALLRLAYLHSFLILSANATDKKPNVLLIVGDDVGTGDVPGYWADSNKVNMPHLESLVAEGVTFTDAHSTPLCAPSRYMFLSGNYQHRGMKFASVWNLNYESGQFRPGQKSLAHMLGENGYDTAIFGKWHLGGKINQTNTMIIMFTASKTIHF
jgi:arylsulfatase A-like enzyme